MESNPTDELVSDLKSVGKEAAEWFDNLGSYTDEAQGYVLKDRVAIPVWNLLSDKQRSDSALIQARIATFGARLLTALKTAPLMEQADEIMTRTLYAKCHPPLLSRVIPIRPHMP